MKHIVRTIDEPIYTSPLLDFYFEGLTVGTLDIETTGLSATRNKYILGGLYNCETKEFHQFFAENRDEESDALNAYIEELSKLDVVVTYNGKHFDIPFIEARYRRLNGHDIPVKMPFNFDIYLLLNGHSPVKHFVPNLKQKTIENYLGLWDRRSDEISGAESVEMYNEYERTADPELERQILLHNSDDVLQLVRLMKIIAKCDFHKGMYKCGFPVGRFTINKVHVGRDHMAFSGFNRGEPLDYRCYSVGDYPAHAVFDGRHREFEVKVPIIREHGMAIIDLFAAGIDDGPFKAYPTCDSGFLAVEAASSQNHMEINHFIKAYMNKLSEYMGKEF
ncbi:MAG: ribonuclease H-like domain-containing protein [Eubacterium sp.]|nr:ribonuclease H-like domain-containing protein [Candidatus Colimonas fimequi]